MLFTAEMETTKTKMELQADFVQICILLIESYIMKPPRGEGPSFLYIPTLILVPLLTIWG